MWNYIPTFNQIQVNPQFVLKPKQRKQHVRMLTATSPLLSAKHRAKQCAPFNVEAEPFKSRTSLVESIVRFATNILHFQECPGILLWSFQPVRCKDKRANRRQDPTQPWCIQLPIMFLAGALNLSLSIFASMVVVIGVRRSSVKTGNPWMASNC